MNRWRGFALGLFGAAIMVPAAMGQGAKLSGAETGLLGVKLYDKQIVLIQKFGSPDEVLAVTFGTTAAAGGGAPGGAGGPAGGPPAGAPGLVGGPQSAPGGRKGGAGSLDLSFPVFGDTTSYQKGGPQISSPGVTFGGPPPGGGVPQGPGGGGPGGGPIGGAPQAGGGATDKVTYTRWVYNRNNNKFGFVIDKFGRIVQIEAIGLENKSLKTKRGIGFGANFAQVMKAYQTPDAYEISGDTITLRYLSRLKVAFRLSRLAAKKPQVVTGIVVAAAKN